MPVSKPVTSMDQPIFEGVEEWEEISDLDTPFESWGEYFKTFLLILSKGVAGATVFLLLLAALLLLNTFTSNLRDENAITYLSSVTIGISWVGILAAVCWGLNGGFNVIVMKCVSAEEFGLIRNYLRRQLLIVFLYSIMYCLFISLLYWVMGYVYNQHDKPETT